MQNEQRILKNMFQVNDWLASDPNNVVAVHCKGGKGRTGTLICILLVEHGLFEDAVSRYRKIILFRQLCFLNNSSKTVDRLNT